MKIYVSLLPYIHTICNMTTIAFKLKKKIAYNPKTNTNNKLHPSPACPKSYVMFPLEDNVLPNLAIGNDVPFRIFDSNELDS